MGGASGALGWFGDRVNPIVVKEARQAVRSWAVLVLMLLVLAGLFVLTAGSVLMTDSGSGTEARGAEMFATFNGIVLAVCAIFVPIYTAQRLSSERTGAAADLMHTTTIRPVSVVWGKLVVAMMIALLIFSVAAPFLTLTFLFRGIDLATIGLAIAWDLLLILLAAQTGVFIAALPMSAVLRIFAGVALGLAALWMGGWALAGLVMFGGASSAMLLGGAEWYAMAIGAGMVLLVTGLLFSLSVAATSSAPSNRALLPRAYLSFAWCATLALVAYERFFGSGPSEGAKFWLGVWSVLLSVAMLITLGERREPGTRLLRRRPRTVFGRSVAFLFTSGAQAGIVWCVLMLALSFAAASNLSDLHSRRDLIAFAPMPLWTLVFGLFAVLLRDALLPKRFGTVSTIPIAAFLGAAAAIVPAVIAFVVNPQRWDRRDNFLMANVLGGMIAGSGSGLARQSSMVAGTIAVVLLLVHLRWFWRGYSAYVFGGEDRAVSDGA